ncbi:ester cyclase [Aestuariicoccus sp. MJ-SS9]|uniref:ester cyclase n=1 Tax=Aestuariicoccus sp. MJ-SS9 TaxID=3079855 RepID=UPI002914C869|nr:ester cyclase [Aestuariicoccus sp. MJ-SS9]MDU8910278.1 ester cyclase [Aestuariicoccus sp. MJ-SS9]
MRDGHAVMAPFFGAMREGAEAGRAALSKVAEGALFRMCHPFGDLRGADAWWEAAMAPLAGALPDLERVEYIHIAGRDDAGALWVGSGGYYCGTWARPWLGMPATGQIAHLRFHEFYRIEEGVCVEMQALWDLPEMMMQAGVWPMAPQLGRFLHVPGPQSSDGLGPHDGARSGAARRHVVDMLTALKRHPSEGGPEVMEMERYWHPKMMWYGPAGIGSGRGIEGFRRHHQIPFLKGMPDRGQFVGDITYHFMAEGDYVGVTGWPNMIQTISADGWLGIPPMGKRVTMRSLDFWRLEGGLIRENWVLVDLLDMYAQIGVDVLARMRELAAIRP